MCENFHTNSSILNHNFTSMKVWPYFSDTLYIEDIITILECLVKTIFVVFVGKVFQQIVGSPMGTNCAHFLADIIMCSYEAEFTRLQALLSADKKNPKQTKTKTKTKTTQHLSSIFTYRYIDELLSINDPDCKNYLGQMYPTELEINDATESNPSASYFDL